MSQKSNIEIILEGRGKMILRPETDHRATGGEAAVYIVGQTAIKLYHSPKEKVQWNDVPGKIDFFRKHPHASIVAPQGMVTKPSGEPIGYYMPAVSDTESVGIIQVFTNGFRRRTNFSDKDALVLVDKMRDIICFAHENKALLIDANEMGYFVIPKGPNGPEPRLIDVDCWVIEGRFPPFLPIMPSIKDWHAGNGVFSKETDWFAWAIVSFQVCSGVHPYRGIAAGFTDDDLDKRMQTNVSVLDKRVQLNRAVRDFSCIPGHLLEWYRAVFQQGERSMPPSPFDTTVTLPLVAHTLHAVTVSTSDILVFEKIFGLPNDSIARIFSCGVVVTALGFLADLSRKQIIGTAPSLECEVVKVESGWIAAMMEKDQARFVYIREGSFKAETSSLSFRGKQILRYENRLFVVTENGLVEIGWQMMMGRMMLAVGQTWGVMINSTTWFDGIGVEDAMGALSLVLPLAEKACVRLRTPELDGMRTVNARAGNRFASVIVMDKTGSYQKLEFSTDRDYKTYKCSKERVDVPELNIAILPKGVCAEIVQDGTLDIFVPSSGMHNKIKDKQVTTDMTLANWGDKVVYIQNGGVWGLRMK